MIHYDRVLTVFIHFLCDRSVRYRDGRGGVDTGGVHEKNTKSNPGSGFIVSFFGRSPAPPPKKKDDSDAA